MTNCHRTWVFKTRLVGENHDNSSRREDDMPDERNGQTNPGISSAVGGLRKFARMQIFNFSRCCCREYQPLRTRTCGSCKMVQWNN
ncbi:hypothetical protein TNCV_1274771 [Trichonephila clavipes]|nr:hypothetical protein TNCV_1274771 [Trichonephila clavipes]